MNLLKRWRGNQQEGGNERALARQSKGEVGAGLSRFQDEVDRVFDQFWDDFHRDPWSAGLSQLSSLMDSQAMNWPAVDVSEDDRNVTLHVEVPGLGPDDVDVEVSGNVLTIRGSHQEHYDDSGDDAVKGKKKERQPQVRRRERRYGSFTRTMTLPSYVDPSKLAAQYDKGVLTLTVPKIEGRGPRRVRVSAA